ncbi:DMT family transporter [Paracoccus aerodenitrificans]|uniref:DMT family transporter n=1 Tax=Paracoccus aerodenitrificans TaxID=3017781 RepID=UPI0022F0BDE0|nr:DMT family transporter [Paracoccus aerodenitrificans]WBU64588.1 DMT family transporter [Paracoccus aerodenitrificans]
MTETIRNDLAGVFWMVVTGLCFVAVNGLVKYFGQGLPPAQSAFIRFLFGLVLLAPILVKIARQGIPKDLYGPFILRGALHTLAVILWFYAMTQIPIAEVTAIGFLNPIIATLGAAILLGEALSWRRGMAILVALGGALVVLRPGMRVLELGHLAQISAAVLFGLSYLVARRVAQRVPAEIVVAMLSVTVPIGLFPLALIGWVTPDPGQLLGLALVAVFATAGHYTMTRAFAVAPMAVTQPVTFLQLIWAGLLGMALFAEPFDPMVMLGGGIMIAAISYITWREARLRASEDSQRNSE